MNSNVCLESLSGRYYLGDIGVYENGYFRNKWECSIKVNILEIGLRELTGLIWFLIRSCDLKVI
jgi:hypothetical protein